MIVVADASPLIVLAKIGQPQILPALFGQIFVPPQIVQELSNPAGSSAILDFMQRPPEWLVEKSPARLLAIPMLDVGETAAISLAKELKAELLLVDEALGRHAAMHEGLRITGTIGVLELAAGANLVDLASVFAAVKRTDFWIPHKFLDERLAHFFRKRGTSL